MKRVVALALVLVSVAAACSGESSDPLIGLRASQDVAVGDERFLFAVNEIDGTRRGSPEEEVQVVATPLDNPSQAIEADAVFMWIVPDAIGLYRAPVAFDTPGRWEIEFTISTGEDTDPFLVDVKPEPATVAVGEQAPAVATPTYPETPLSELTTDQEPLETLYTDSLDALLANGRPTVAVFATPAFCTSAACGPMVNQVKDLTTARTDADFIHIEVYSGFNSPGFEPGLDTLVPAVTAFGLPTEPWIFVMDGDGTVVSRLEGVLGEGELESILDSL